MKSDFKFSNLLGTVYREGNLVFTPDGKGILSPVGNRVTYFDLVSNKSFTFDYEHRKNISHIELNKNGTLMISVDIDGRAILVNFIRRTVLYHFKFKSSIQDLKFSPNGNYFGVAIGRHVEVWNTPNPRFGYQFAPFVKYRTYTGHYDDVVSISWSYDSRFFLTASKDLTVRLFTLFSSDSSISCLLSGHKEALVGAFFSNDQESIYTISKDGSLFQWNYSDDSQEENDLNDNTNKNKVKKWYITEKHYFNQNNSKITAIAFHQEKNLLVAGFSNGVFALYELPSFVIIHSLSISQNNIDFVSINKSGEWLAFGASKLGQLLVWEWQSESYILKQQGHFDSTNAVVFSPDGSKIISAADDGKIKVWDTNSSFSLVTFTEHMSGVMALQFSQRGNVLFSASLDGSVRAWDLTRYRNFRTFTAPERVQFSSLAVDSSGEIVCAGSSTDFDIHLWSIQTGQYLDKLKGHTAPLSGLVFTADGLLVSSSWDGTVRVWNVFGRSQASEDFDVASDVLALDVRPDGKQAAAASLDGQISFWSIENGDQVALIDGRRDLSGGRLSSDRFTAANSTRSKYFTTINYSADGSCILAAGVSNFICLYDIDSQVLLKKFTISMNIDIGGTQKFLNSKNLTEAGPISELDTSGEAENLQDRLDNTLPGASRGDLSVRRTHPEIRASSVRFSPTNRLFAASVTEGIVVYSVDDYMIFDPFDLDIDITPSSTRDVLTGYDGKEDPDYLKALIMSFRLNENYLIQQVIESIPTNTIPVVARRLPEIYLEKFIELLAQFIDQHPHIEFYLIWVSNILSSHGGYIKLYRQKLSAPLRNIQRALNRIQNDIIKVAEDNNYAMQYLLASGSLKNLRIKSTDTDENEKENNKMAIDEEFNGFSDNEA